MIPTKPLRWSLNFWKVWVKDYQCMGLPLVAKSDSPWSFLPRWLSTGTNAIYSSAGLKLRPWGRLAKQLKQIMNTQPLLNHCPLLLWGSELHSVVGQGHHTNVRDCLHGRRHGHPYHSRAVWVLLRMKTTMTIRLLLAREAREVSHER